MSKHKNRSYKSFRREFKALQDSGCRLYFPEGKEIMPDKLAETIVGDRKATYMRDSIYDQKGRLIKIHFTRVALK